jgi:multicomponent Na+:H+ antiporter subunit D
VVDVSYDTGAAHLTPLTFAVPIVAACLLLAVGKRLPHAWIDRIATATAAAVVGLNGVLLATAAAGRVVTWSGGWTPRHGFSVGIVLAADPVNSGLALGTAVLITVALVYSWRYFDTADAHFHALMLLFLAGMEGFALSGDLFDMFVFFELMGAVAYALTGFKVEDPSAVQGGLNFGIVNSLGAYLTLTGIAVLYARTGELGLPQLSAALSGRAADALVVAAFVLVVTGFLVKSAMVPFHFWLADAHAVAPTPVCVLFSGVMVELGVYGVARVYWVVFSDALPDVSIKYTFLVLGTITAATGAIMCFLQRHIKRLLAYSTIAHVGLFLMGFALLDSDGMAGTALYVAGHAGIKAALFLLAGVVLNQYRTVDELELHGRGKGARLMPVLFIIGAVSLAGLPPFGTGLGKSVLEDALIKGGYPWGAAVVILVSAITGGAVLRVVLRVYFGLGSPRDEDRKSRSSSGDEEEPELAEPLRRLPYTMIGAICVLLLGGLAVGAAPGFGPAVGGAAESFVDRAGYVAESLHRAAGKALVPVPDVDWTALGVWLGLLSASLAVVVALLALYSNRLPSSVRLLSGATRPIAAGLRALHTGHVGDYVAWMLIGVAALGALVGLPLINT